MKWLLIISLSCISANAFAESKQKKGPSRLKYRHGKKYDFKRLLVEGQLKRPEISVVTGDTNDDGDGLLRLRENFLDHQAIDLGVDIP